MSVHVQCPCGQRFAALPELIGQQVQCSTCGQAFVVAAPQPAPQAAQPLTNLETHFPASTSAGHVSRPTAAPRKRNQGKPNKKSKIGLFVLGGGGIVGLLLAVILAVAALYAARESVSRSTTPEASDPGSAFGDISGWSEDKRKEVYREYRQERKRQIDALLAESGESLDELEAKNPRSLVHAGNSAATKIGAKHRTQFIYITTIAREGDTKGWSE